MRILIIAFFIFSFISSNAQTAFETVVFIHAENVETGKKTNVVFTVSQWEQFQKSGEKTFTAKPIPESKPTTVMGSFDPVIYEYSEKDGKKKYRVSTRNSQYN